MVEKSNNLSQDLVVFKADMNHRIWTLSIPMKLNIPSHHAGPLMVKEPSFKAGPWFPWSKRGFAASRCRSLFATSMPWRKGRAWLCYMWTISDTMTCWLCWFPYWAAWRGTSWRASDAWTAGCTSSHGIVGNPTTAANCWGSPVPWRFQGTNQWNQ